jgi:hypothetical protein
MESARTIFMLINKNSVQEYEEALLCHIDGESNILIYGFGRRLEGFTERIHEAVAPNESDEMIATALRLRQWIAGCFLR